MSDTRLGKISEGARERTGYYPFKKFFEMLGGLMPEKGPEAREESVKHPSDLGQEIAGVSRMVLEPASSSADWDNIYQAWMDGTIEIEDMSEGQLKSIYDELRGYEGQEPETMIEELTQFRDRMYR